MRNVMENLEKIDSEEGALINYCTVVSNQDDGTEIGEDSAENPYEGGRNDISGSLVGMTKNTVDEMYELYCDHAKLIGFSVRKGTSRFSSKGIETSKTFLCSCEGLRKSGATLKKKKVGITRTNCKASLTVKIKPFGGCEVIRHNTVHNHELFRKDCAHLHRLERRIADGKTSIVIENNISSGMGAAASDHCIAHEIGSEENIDHSMKDPINFVGHLQRKFIEGGDAQRFLAMIKDENSLNPDFFYSLKVDDQSRLANIFWRDSLMKEDYSIYGDVVVFDTTFRENKYDMICAHFVGINNHKKNVMFGCAFISEMKGDTFEWLLTEFRKSMGGKYPVTVFTDQDFAIATAIQKVFPESRHRLSLWHLYQNAVTSFEDLKGNIAFQEEFNKCLSNCVDKEELECCWNKMISKFNLQNHSWFMRLYRLKEKWCPALNKKYFSAGIRSSHCSESTNQSIEFKTRTDTNLTEFYILFRGAVKNWRNIEREDEFNSSRTEPEIILEKKGLIKHATEVFTLTAYRDFEKEFIKCITASSVVAGAEDSIVVYDVGMPDDIRRARVEFDTKSKAIKCACMKFEECGMLCYHSLRVLHINSVQDIPNSYILKRWTKNAKFEFWGKMDKPDKRDDASLWRYEMARKFYNLILLCEGNERARKYIEEAYERDLICIKSLICREDGVESTHNH